MSLNCQGIMRSPLVSADAAARLFEIINTFGHFSATAAPRQFNEPLVGQPAVKTC